MGLWIAAAPYVLGLYAAVLGFLGLIESVIGERRNARAMCLPCVVSWLGLGAWLAGPAVWRGDLAAGATAATWITVTHLPGLAGAVRGWRAF